MKWGSACVRWTPALFTPADRWVCSAHTQRNCAPDAGRCCGLAWRGWAQPQESKCRAATVV